MTPDWARVQEFLRERGLRARVIGLLQDEIHLEVPQEEVAEVQRLLQEFDYDKGDDKTCSR